MMNNLHINHGWENHTNPCYLTYEWVEPSSHSQSVGLTSGTNKNKTKFKSLNYMFEGELVKLDEAFPWAYLLKQAKADDSPVLSWEASFIPKSDLGKKLWEIRKRAIANGMKLFSDEEIFNEIDKLRGEYA